MASYFRNQKYRKLEQKRKFFICTRGARKVFTPGKFHDCGEAGKGLLGKKMRGWGKLIKEEMVFPHVIFSPSHIQTKKSSSLFSFSSFSFPLFPFFFISPFPFCLSFHFFSPAPFPPPGHSILHNIYP